jgi:hypothetical protein
VYGRKKWEENNTIHVARALIHNNNNNNNECMEKMTTNDRNGMADFKGIKKKNEKEQKQINLK